MSKIDEIYKDGLKEISYILDEHAEVKNDELAFSEISRVIEQGRIEAGNEYIKMSKMHQCYSEEEID
jgi:predicted nucleotidyltransferase